jgi:hypothetical protein
VSHLDLDRHPAVVPAGYRIRYRFFWLPVLVAGRYRWCEHVPIVQRYTHEHARWTNDDDYWHDCGFYDEVMADLRKPDPFPE